MTVCNLQPATRTGRQQSRGKRGERQAYEAVTTVGTFVQIDEGSYSQVCAKTAVAMLLLLIRRGAQECAMKRFSYSIQQVAASDWTSDGRRRSTAEKVQKYRGTCSTMVQSSGQSDHLPSQLLRVYKRIREGGRSTVAYSLLALGTFVRAEHPATVICCCKATARLDGYASQQQTAATSFTEQGLETCSFRVSAR